MSSAAILAALKRFFLALVPAAIARWWADLRKKMAIADKGAADQREAEDKATDQIAREAEGRAHELHDQSLPKRRSRLDRWRRP